MTRQQLDKALKFFEAGLDGAGYAVRITLKSGQVMQGCPKMHDNDVLPMDGMDGGGPIAIMLADIAAIERIEAS